MLSIFKKSKKQISQEIFREKLFQKMEVLFFKKGVQTLIRIFYELKLELHFLFGEKVGREWFILSSFYLEEHREKILE